MSGYVSSSKGVTRRGFLTVAVSAIVAGVVAGVGAYYAGTLAAPVKEVVKEVTKTVTSTITLAPGAPVTATVTLTAPPTTVTKTVTTTVTATTPPKPAPKEIKIGALPPLTGAMSSDGLDSLWAYQYAIEEVNKKGGVYVAEYGTRIPVKLIYYDCKSDPTTAVSIVDRLYSVDGVDYIWGPCGSYVHEAAIPAAMKYGIIYFAIGLSATEPHKKGYRYLFSPFSKYYQWSIVSYSCFNDLLPKEERPRRVGIWQENTILGRELADSYVTNAPKYGYEVVLNEVYTMGAKDFSDLILKSKAKDVEFVAAVPTLADAVTMVRQCKELGFSPKAMMLARGGAWYPFVEALGKDADYILHTPAGWCPDFPTPGNKELVDAFIKANNRNPGMPIVGAAYSLAQIFFQAVEKAGSLDKEKIRQVLVTEEFDTVSGKVKFNEEGIWETIPPTWSQWQNGEPRTIYPKEFATSRLWYPMPPWEKRK